MLKILVFMCFYKSLAQETRICSTPLGTSGICKSILNCPFLKGLAVKDNIWKEEVYHLRRSACGFNKSMPLVCCPEYGPETCTPTVKPPDPWTGCCGRARTRRYKVGTTFAEIDQYPWMATIEYENNNRTGFYCSATLISNRYLISTAACFDLKNKRVGTPRRVRLGDYNITNDGPDCVENAEGVDCNNGAILIPIQRFAVHPAFDGRQQNDISLIKLSKMTPYTDFIRPICLPTVDLTIDPPNNLRLYVAGWGATETASQSEILRHVGLPFVALDICQNAYKRLVSHVVLSSGHVCAGGQVGDSCRGDTGAPLMFDNGLFEEVIGLVSFGPIPCGRTNFPGVYTKIIVYDAWIRQNIEP